MKEKGAILVKNIFHDRQGKFRTAQADSIQEKMSL